MRIKRIEADSVNEAMLMLRRELGEHAIILHTKQLPARGVTAWFKTPRIEILGAVDEPMMKTGIEVIGGLPTLDRGYYETPRGAAAPAPMRQDHLTRERINHVAAEHREPATSSGTGSRAGATPFEGTGSRAGATPVPATKKAGAAARAGQPQIALTGYAERRARLDGTFAGGAARVEAAPAPATTRAQISARPQVSPAPPPSASAVAQAPAAGTRRRKAGKGAPAAATSVQELIAQATDRQTAREDIAERLAKFRSAMPLTPSHVDEIEALEARTEVTAAGESTALRDSLVDPLAGITFAAVEWTRAGRRPRRVAFVGPTGAGKTTTLAKVAARAQLEQGRRVGIITIDTYRIGAVPQLQAYAEILGAPLAVAETPEALADALARMNDVDIVFIDTIGRSPLGGGAEGLAPFLSVAAADEVHLVLSAITRPGDSMRAARAFARLVPNRLSITKIDETEDHSALLMAARGTGLPLQWLGTGQEVPDDLDVATPDRLLGLVATEYVA